MRPFPRFVSAASLAATVAACVVLAACGSSGGNSASSGATSGTSTSGSSGSSSGTSSAASAGLAAATALYNTGLKTTATFPGPTTSVPVKSEKVAVISVGQATVGASTTAVYVQEAIKGIGWTAPATFDGKFSATVASGLIEQAVNSGYNALVLIAITPSTVASAVNQAAAKNIPIACILCGPNPDQGVNAKIINVEPSPTALGQMQATYPIVNGQGKGTTLIYADDEFAFTAVQINAAIAYLKTNCPGCTVIEKNMTSESMLTPGIPVLSSVLSQHPKGTINYLIAPYDSAAQPFVELTHQDGRDEIQVIGYSATPNFAKLIGAGNPPGAAADIPIPLPYMAWSSIDLLARALVNQPQWDASNMPVGLLTKANYSDYPADSQFLQPAGDWRAKFQSLWKR
jgi:ABC-type sugar transport system substrate-binding protein